MTKDEALKLALEALKECHQLIYGDETKGGVSDYIDGYYGSCFDFVSNKNQTNEAITAVKEALAQPEPVMEYPDYVPGIGWRNVQPPPQRSWVGLTEDEVALIAADCSLVTPSDFYFAQAIEAKLKEKNT